DTKDSGVWSLESVVCSLESGMYWTLESGLGESRLISWESGIGTLGVWTWESGLVSWESGLGTLGVWTGLGSLEPGTYSWGLRGVCHCLDSGRRLLERLWSLAGRVQTDTILISRFKRQK
ncbi:hypothetical protein SARC_05480, partial [Sphaeroforma arctica JP610]